MSRLSITSRIKLNDGHAIPRFGLGVYESSPGPETYDAVLAALNAGYRQIDGAEWYENEADCGRAIVDFMASSGVAREEIWFTTKLMHNRGREHVITAVKESLRLCGTSIDLYLVHDPSGGEDVRLESWLGCCDAKDQGLVKSIGVSNFGVRHLEHLLAAKPKYVPSVNQVDLHPFMTRKALVEYCQAHGIVLEAWAPLVRGERFTHPTVVALSNKYSKTPAQVLIRYGLQRDFIVIPKSTKEARIVANCDVFDFELETADVDLLTTLNENLLTDWDVTECP